MKITIGESKYEQIKIKGRLFRRLLEIQETLESKGDNPFTATDLDLMVEFICEVFDNQFTSDDIWDELDVSDIMPQFKNVAEEVMKRSQSKMENLQKNSKGKK